MSITTTVIKELASKAILQNYGEARGAALNFLLFGAYGVPGLVDDAELVAAASKSDNSQLGEEFTAELAMSLVLDVASTVLQKSLSTSGIKIFELLSAPTLFLRILVSPRKLGNGELPIEIRQQIIDAQNTTPSQLPTPGKPGLSGDPISVGHTQVGNSLPTLGNNIGQGMSESPDHADDGMTITVKDSETGEVIKPATTDEEGPIIIDISPTPPANVPKNHGGGDPVSVEGHPNAGEDMSHGGFGPGTTYAGPPTTGGGNVDGPGHHKKKPTKLA